MTKDKDRTKSRLDPAMNGWNCGERQFNPHYFLDILRHNRALLADRYNPGLDTDTPNALFVLMLMRLD